MAEKATLLTKLTLKGMNCKPANRDENGSPYPLAKVYGRANGLKAKEDSTGKVHVGIVGQFEGVNIADNKVFRSSILYLPEGLHEMLENPLTAAKAAEKDLTIEFGFLINSFKSSAPIGYSYSAVPLLQATEVDDLFELRNMIAGEEQKQLGAGEPAATVDPAQQAAATNAALNTAGIPPADTKKKRG